GRRTIGSAAGDAVQIDTPLLERGPQGHPVWMWSRLRAWWIMSQLGVPSPSRGVSIWTASPAAEPIVLRPAGAAVEADADHERLDELGRKVFFYSFQCAS
ncbi:MAG: hypothetical protein AAFX94_19030, partial [Myxococcota bacterium]